MEGGVLPWKRQAGEQESYGDYSKLSQPLPNPPEGYYWTKDDQGEYRLLEEATGRLLRHLPPPLDGNGSDESKIVAVTSAASCSNVVVATPIDEFVPDAPSVSPDYIFHTILPDDTLIGICLRYKVTAAILRRHNAFTGENFRLVDELKIPTEHMATAGLIQPQHSQSPEVLLQKFKNATGLLDVEARLYMSDAGGDLSLAIKNWAADENWEQSQETPGKHQGRH